MKNIYLVLEIHKNFRNTLFRLNFFDNSYLKFGKMKKTKN